MRIFKTMLLGIVMALLGLGCSTDDGISVVTDPIQEQPESDPKLLGFAPQSGPKETVVTISGENFGKDKTKVQVFFNDKEAIVQSINNTQITVMVPPKAFSGKVKVQVGEIELLGSKFTYEVTDIQVTTLAGSSWGYENGSGENARFKSPRDIARDADGNLYVTDRSNHRIRKITPSGVVTTLAGSTSGDEDGTGENAKFKRPHGITIDTDGNLYVADFSNDKLRKITPIGVVSTLAGAIRGNLDGIGTNAQMWAPTGVYMGVNGVVYFSDSKNNKLRKVAPNGQVSTIAGGESGESDGTRENASFNDPRGLARDADGNLYVVDSSSDRIRKITPNGVVSTIAGSILGSDDGPIELASFNNPRGLAIDAEGIIYIADSGNHRIRKITPEGMVSTIAGSEIGEADGIGAEAKFNKPIGIIIDEERTLYVVDSSNHRIRKIIQE